MVKIYLFIGAVFIAGLLLITTVSNLRVISPKNAWKHVGKSKRVVMQVVNSTVADNGEVTLYPEESGDFVVILDANGIFPANPNLFYLNKQIRVEGKIEQDENRFVVRLRSREQIKFPR